MLLSACAGTPQSDRLLRDLPVKFIQPHEITSTPFYAYQDHQCGPSALASLLEYNGIEVDFAALVRRLYIPERKGTLQIELVSASREFNLIPYIIKPDLYAVLDEVRSGRPVLVLQNLGVNWYPKWHYAVVIGYNLPQKELILRSGTIKRYVMSLYTFERTWQRSQSWALLLLKPGELPKSGSALRFMNALRGFGLEQHQSVLLPAYQTAMLHWPDTLVLKMGYGNLLHQAGEYKSALQQYEAVIRQEPNYAPALNNAAQIYLRLGDPVKARNYVQRAIAIGGVYIEEYRSTLSDVISAEQKMK